MFHAYDTRFGMTGNLEKKFDFQGELNETLLENTTCRSVLYR